MYIISLTYKVPLDKVDQHPDAHIDYLNRQYEKGNFHASGRKVLRTGGIILSKLTDKNELLRILDEDPFKKNQLADYELTEWVPNKTSDELRFLME